uniref:Uncharacterized protein n=1 Tax=Rhizophora mucronata TaxID=61149 RepID=A0A2P2JEJ1_RHIMU
MNTSFGECANFFSSEIRNSPKQTKYLLSRCIPCFIGKIEFPSDSCKVTLSMQMMLS